MKEKLYAAMSQVQNEYTIYQSSSHLPHLTAHMSQEMPLRVSPFLIWTNNAATFLTNIGVIEKLIHKSYNEGLIPSNKTVLQLQELFFCHGASETSRPQVQLFPSR